MKASIKPHFSSLTFLLFCIFCFSISSAQDSKRESRKRGELLSPISDYQSNRILPGGSFDALVHLEQDPASITKAALPIAQPLPESEPTALLRSLNTQKSLTVMPGGGFDGLIFLKRILNKNKSQGTQSPKSASPNRSTLVRPIQPEKKIALMPGGGFDALSKLKRENPFIIKKVAIPIGNPLPANKPSALIRSLSEKESMLMMPGGAFNPFEKLK